MISISLYRRELERRVACDEGLALYDSIAALLPESDRLRHRRIRVARWTPLHSLWLYTAGYARLATWLEQQGLIPRADLAGASLVDANLTRANLTVANLTRADLTGANLVDANLTGAYLTRANLTRAYLAGANLTRADLTGASLVDAYLVGANLTHADLAGANLAGAYRGPSPAIPGWRANARGYLERES